MSSNKTPVKVSLVPFQQENVASNQQGVPLPFFSGTRLVAIRWMAPAMNGISMPSKSTGKKG